MRPRSIGGFVAVCVLLAGCGSTTTTTTKTIARSRAGTAHHARQHFPKYAGLGATVAAFRHDNTIFCLNCALVPGEAAYSIKATRHGRVTEYDVYEAFKPAASSALRLTLVEGTMIPGPPTSPIRQDATCEDFRVPQLKKLIGVEYAEASTSPGVNFATMQAVRTPTCP